MCLHYLVKLIARVLSLYITYFSTQVVDFSHQVFTNCWNNSFQQSTTVSVVFTDKHYIFFASDDVTVTAGCSASSQSSRDGRVAERSHYRRRSEKAAKATASVCCCWRMTVWTWTVTPAVEHCCCNCALWLWRLIVWLLITFSVTVFRVLWLFLSHAAVVKRYNAFCVKLTAISDTEQNNISKSTFFVCVSKHFHI